MHGAGKSSIGIDLVHRDDKRFLVKAKRAPNGRPLHSLQLIPGLVVHGLAVKVDIKALDLDIAARA